MKGTRRTKVFNRFVAVVLSLTMLLVFPIVSFADVFAGSADATGSTQVEQTDGSTADGTGDTGSDQTADSTTPTEKDQTTSGGSSDASSDSGNTDSTKNTVSYPRQTFDGEANGVKVNVVAPEGALPEGTTMEVKAVASSDVKDAVEKAAKRDINDMHALDISFHKDGKEIEPKAEVTVQFSGMNIDGDSIDVFHMDNASSSAKKVAESKSTSSATVNSDTFSIYVITDGAPKVKTYKFYDENGDSVLSEQSVKTGDSLVEPKTPTKEGCKFMGWATEKGGSTYFTDFGAQTVTGSDTVNLYAVFQQAYYVFFMDGTDDDARVIQTKEGVSGKSVDTLGVVVPLPSNKAVTGWYTDKALTNKVTSVVLNDSNVTLYPKVEDGNYLIFDANGGSYTEPEFVAADGVTTKPADPTREGYTFNFWAANDYNIEYSFGNAITSEVTLHAVWTPKANTKYTVIHWQENANDDNYSFKESETLTGTSGLNTNAIAKKYDGFTAKTITQKTINGDGSTIVNVYYARNIYSVKFFQYKEGHWEGGFLNHSWIPGSWNEMTGLTITAKYGANIKDKWPTSTAKMWSTTKDTTEGPFQSGISTMPLNGDSFYYINSNGRYTMNLHFYMQELGKTSYALDHTDSFKSDSNGWSTTKEDHYDIEGFTYTKNVADGSKFEQDGNGSNSYSVSFKYSRNSYDIKFVNNGSVVNTVTKQYQADISKVTYTPEKPASMPTGSTFEGWYDNEACKGEAYSFTGKTMPSSNITLYAKWAAPKYTATVHTKMANEDGDAPVTIDIAYGLKIDQGSMPKIAVPDGYKWIGWSTYNKNTGEYTPYNFDTEVYGNVELYPFYISATKYVVTYDLNEGTGTAPTDSFKYASGSKAEVQSGITVTPPEGKVFLNWNTQKDGKGKTYYPKDKILVNDNTTLYAQYGSKESTTSLTYHANYPTGITAQQPTTDVVNSLKNNGEVTLKANAFTEASEYYTFEGWNTEANGQGTTYAAGTNVRVDTLGTGNDLYAMWAPRTDCSYTVKYVDSANHSKELAEAKSCTGKTFGQTYNENAKTIAGYTADSATKNITINSKTGNELIFYYTANTDTKYTVKYYYENAGSYSTTADSSVERTGTTGTDATVTTADKTPTGNYVLDDNAAHVYSAKIAGDGSTVLKVYFKQQFTVKFVNDDDSEVSTKSDYKYDDQTVKPATNPTAKNQLSGYTYTFDKWTPDVASKVTGDATYKATYTKTANSNTKYTVEYYYEKDGKYPTTATSKDETRTGTTDEDVTVTTADKTPTGKYVLDDNAAHVYSAKIAGDGSTVLKVYFKQQFTVKFVNDDGSTVTSNDKYSYGESTVKPSTTPTAKNQEAGFTYTFDKWTPDVAEKVTADATYKATYAATANSNTKYTVEYYYEKDGKYPDTATSKDGTRTGTTGEDATVTTADKKPTGNYVLDDSAAHVYSAKIAGDGSTVLKVYFKQQFTVKFVNDDGSTVTSNDKYSYGESTVKPSTTPTAKNQEAGFTYTFDKWTPDVAEKVTGDATYKATYTATANSNTKYTVEYFYEKDGKYPDKATSKDETRTGTTDEDVTVTTADKTPTGNYVLDDNAAHVYSAKIAGDGSTVLKVYFKQQFTVKFVNDDDSEVSTKSDYKYDDQTVKPATNPTAKNQQTGYTYTFDKWTPDVASKVTGDATYKATYTKALRTDITYTVNYLEQDTDKVLATAKTVTGQTFDTTVTETAAAVTDYTVVGSDTQIMKLNADNLVMNFYYTKNPTPPPASDKYTLTINYVDEQGNKLETSYSDSLDSGAAYSQDSPVISGYKLVDTTQATVAGTMPEENVTINVVYTKTAVTPNNPNKPKTPTTPTPASDKSASTGDSWNGGMWLILLLLGAAGVTGTTVLRRKESEED